MKQEEKKDNIISCGVNDSALDSLQYLASLRCVPLDNYLSIILYDHLESKTVLSEKVSHWRRQRLADDECPEPDQDPGATMPKVKKLTPNYKGELNYMG